MKIVLIVTAIVCLSVICLSSCAGNSHPADPDRLVLDQLSKAGSDLKKPHPLQFFVYFPTESGADSAAGMIREGGFIVEVDASADRSSHLCLAEKKMIPTHAELVRIRNRLNQIASKYGGQYDGWGTEVVK